MKLEDTRIPIGGTFRCCLQTVAVEYEGQDVQPGATSQCPHCKERFTLDSDGWWRPSQPEGETEQEEGR